jgi:precorrin-6B methylase 1
VRVRRNCAWLYGGDTCTVGSTYATKASAGTSPTLIVAGISSWSSA